MYNEERYDLDMKLLVLFIFISTSSAFAEPDILKCLGREEAYIHKNKIGGAYKLLNQAMIGELVLLGKSISIGPSLHSKLCSRKTLFPSFLLLEKILLEGSRTLRYNKGGLTSTKDLSDRQTLRTLNKNIFNIFVTFLSKLQAQVNDPRCLTRKYPQLRRFYIQSQHILEEQGAKKILANFTELPNLLQDIKTGRWKLNCEKES